MGEYYNQQNGGCLYVAEIEDGSKIIGNAAIRSLKQFHSTCELKRMFVSKEFRKLGIGHRLLNTTLDFARKVGYSKILLYSSSCLKISEVFLGSEGEDYILTDDCKYYFINMLNQ